MKDKYESVDLNKGTHVLDALRDVFSKTWRSVTREVSGTVLNRVWDSVESPIRNQVRNNILKDLDER